MSISVDEVASESSSSRGADARLSKRVAEFHSKS